ncbi:MAG: rRNA pseudouridine synthase [Lachnospiraceae bacterium]|nr:rRNA pseudouridine synthase [Lachnospiraceae bacterium]
MKDNITDNTTEEIRINKYLASCGICSRREADRLIEEGRVKVGDRIASAGMKVTGRERITVNGQEVTLQKETRVVALYKPEGYLCTTKDDHGGKTIYELPGLDPSLKYAGRLDKDSEGLLLLTNNGDLIEGMMRGANGHEKEYEVAVDRPVTDEMLSKMRAGIFLEELSVTTRPCFAEKTGERSFRIILTQGLNRQIRRMCETLGMKVLRLKRVRVMNITLEGLKKGSCRQLSAEEVEGIRQMLRRKMK